MIFNRFFDDDERADFGVMKFVSARVPWNLHELKTKSARRLDRSLHGEFKHPVIASTDLRAGPDLHYLK